MCFKDEDYSFKHMHFVISSFGIARLCINVPLFKLFQSGFEVILSRMMLVYENSSLFGLV